MDLEQLPPNKPNFLLVVVLFAVAIVALIAGGLLLVRHIAKQEPSGHPAGNPRSSLQVTLPVRA